MWLRSGSQWSKVPVNQASTVNGPAACVSESQCQTCSSGSWDALSGTCSQTSCAAQAPRQDQDTVHGGTKSRITLSVVPFDATKWFFIGDLDVETDFLCSEELEVFETFETEVITTFLASLSAVDAPDPDDQCHHLLRACQLARRSRVRSAPPASHSGLHDAAQRQPLREPLHANWLVAGLRLTAGYALAEPFFACSSLSRSWLSPRGGRVRIVRRCGPG